VLETTVEIRADDIDALGRVGNAAYFTYLEELFAHGLEAILGDDWVTVRVELEFAHELVLVDRQVKAEAVLERVGNSSLSFRVAVHRADGGPASAEGRVVLVAWSPERRASRPLTRDEVGALRIAASPVIVDSAERRV
jgi:acyl-CoA thioesterase FadM